MIIWSGIFFTVDSTHGRDAQQGVSGTIFFTVLYGHIIKITVTKYDMIGYCQVILLHLDVEDEYRKNEHNV